MKMSKLVKILEDVNKDLNVTLNWQHNEMENVDAALAQLKDARDALNGAIEELDQPEEPAQRFYVGQPVLVKGRGQDKWVKRIFIAMTYGGMYSVEPDSDTSMAVWDECKPDPDAPSLPNWQTVTEPTRAIKCNGGIVIYIGAHAGNLGWCNGDTTLGRGIVYAIITKPEFK